MLTELLDTKKTLIVVGPGGVGKTTTSAAFAVHAARQGKKVLVLTVDPARRLANALGLKELGNTEVRIDDRLFEEAGVPLQAGPNGEKGALFGMMLDVKSTFDALIDRYAPNADVRQRIMNNPFYQQASTALAGSQEYMAMEKLYEIREQRTYDLIVLDTPPTSNALDFLTAPERLEDFFGSQTAKWMVQGAKAAGRFGLGMLKLNTFVMRGLNRFVGADMLLNLLEFIQSFHEMYAGFKARAARVREILRSPDVAFVIVTSTDRAAIDEATFFHDQLLRGQMPFGGILVNRVRQPYLEPEEATDLGAEILAKAPPVGDRVVLARVAKTIEEAVHAWEILAYSDQRAVADLRRTLGAASPVAAVPLFERDVHDIETLARYAEHVVSAIAKRVTAPA